ncbi:universal stress protein [Streptomyces sp. NPDC048172]|uniref:universal stress protein n=1 Tax=Streptomyces sp. NPDC048172 TaxID=3365505 RepID=UPI003723097C
MTMTRHLAVGLDGSEENLAAARWAADEAARCGLPLHLVYASAGLPPDAFGRAERASPRHWPGRILRDTAEELARLHPELKVVKVLEPRAPQYALLDVAKAAEFLVIGTNAPGALGGCIAGAMSLLIAARARRPVVLVRAGGDGAAGAAGPYGRPADADGETVLALDPTHAPGGVLAFAFAFAARRAGTLRVVHTWRYPYGTSADVREKAGEAAENGVDEALRPWRVAYPDVPVKVRVERGEAVPALLEAATGASLVVVGRRVRRIPVGARLGPVTHALIHRAPAPLAVVPHE